MSAALVRHLFKILGLITTFVVILTATAFVLMRASRWFLHFELGPINEAASPFHLLARAFNQAARRKTLAAVVVGLACLLIRGALIPILKIPVPKDHDEYSHLLAADTFAHGRLTNPTPPMWVHFESIHIILQPTYMSKYPPGQGLLLAAGQLLGHPWIGIWFTTALACALMCWMLQAWLPAKWALLGGLLAVLQFGVLRYWMNTYYCASLPALAGALVLGALPRLQKRPCVTQALLLALGLSLLALTRPYEGLIFSLPVAGALLLWIWRQRGLDFRRAVLRVVFPMTLILVSTIIFTGYYNFRASGDALVMPYQIDQKKNSVIPLFLWERPRPKPVYRHAEMRNWYAGWEVSEYRNTVTHGFAHMTRIKFERYWSFYFAPFLTIPLISLPCVLRDKRIRFLLIVAALTITGLELEVWSQPHYAAPLTCVFFAIAVQGIRHLQFWRWRGRQVGKTLVWAIVVGTFAFDAAWLSAVAVHINSWRLYNLGNQHRATIERKMEQAPGGQLVLVRYTPSHSVFEEWVYNRADIEHAKVVWARDMGAECNQELVNYFKGHQIWLLEPDSDPVKLKPYSAAELHTREAAVSSDCGSY
jgi:hypothetical protein